MNKLNKIQHEALLSIQWRGNDKNGTGNYCPYCRGYEGQGHATTCKIAIAIKAFESVVAANNLVKEE